MLMQIQDTHHALLKKKKDKNGNKNNIEKRMNNKLKEIQILNRN